MLHCPKCGHANTAQSNFCSHCGESLGSQHVSGDTTRLIPLVVDEKIMESLTPDDEAAISSLPAGSALLIVRRGSGEGERFLLDGDSTVAGRHPGADIFLDDITVSRHHAEFTKQDHELRVRDLGSLNGTYVNRRQVDGSVPIKTGDEVQVGKFKMVVFVSSRGLK